MVCRILSVSACVSFLGNRVYSFYKFLKEKYEAELRTKSITFHSHQLLRKAKLPQLPSSILTNLSISVPTHIPFLSFLRGRNTPSSSIVYPSDCVLSPIFAFGILGAYFIDWSIHLQSFVFVFFFFFASLASHLFLALGSFPPTCNKYAEVSLVLKAAASHNLVLEYACFHVLAFSPSHGSWKMRPKLLYLTTYLSPLLDCFCFTKPLKQLYARPLMTSTFRLKSTHWIQHLSLQHWIPWAFTFIKLSSSLAFMASLLSVSLTVPSYVLSWASFSASSP